MEDLKVFHHKFTRTKVFWQKRICTLFVRTPFEMTAQFDYFYGQIYVGNVAEKVFKEREEENNLKENYLDENKLEKNNLEEDNSKENKSVEKNLEENHLENNLEENNSEENKKEKNENNSKKLKIDEDYFSDKKEFYLSNIKNFISSYPSAAFCVPTFLLPRPPKTSEEPTRWSRFAAVKGIRKKRREVYDAQNDTFVPAWGRYSHKNKAKGKSYGVIGETTEGEQKRLEKNKNKVKGMERRIMTNQRYHKRY